ncbi:hypothetical protein TNCV_1068661, partial [Trichonephila clavipes]
MASRRVPYDTSMKKKGNFMSEENRVVARKSVPDETNIRRW